MKHIQAKKSLGQNFLKSKKALLAMVEAGGVTVDDTVVEIGPGKGALTRVLLEAGATVIAFEKDHRLIELLQEEFKEYVESKKFFLYEKDILEVDISTSFPRRRESSDSILDSRLRGNDGSRELRGNDTTNEIKYKLIANIPYYITGEITRRFLTSTHKPTTMILLVQKEVAERICDSKESILSLSVKVFGTPKKIMTVKKEFFSPAPKVDSAIIQISNIQNPFTSQDEEEHFFKIIKKAFGQKRKKLNTNLKEYKDEIHNWELIKDKRAEDIGVEEWKEIVGIK